MIIVTQVYYEIKPSSRWVKESEKMNQIVDFCLKNNIKFIWVNEKNITEYIDETQFGDNNLAQYNMLKKGIK